MALPTRSVWAPAGALAGLLLLVAAAPPAVDYRAPGDETGLPVSYPADMDVAQSDYVEQCGGCHGIKGNAAPAELPNLQGRVGWFMCLPEGRDYLMRLPNIARSRIDDNEQLAALMNFMVFGLGGKSTPAGTKPFTAAEVAVGRTKAFNSVSLIKTRAEIVEKVIQKCGAPASLRLMYPQGTSAMPVLAAAGKPPKS
ncbi:cytochrome C [Sandarakinorhabdus limnophila]|uniref:cytochrome C n=1 Tax=Sandarakinorhabdus limnophila TaxID=210512 RepID=UPI002352E7DC|nr:cytochrome C [Sandarakinorhabdus limnophila]